MNAPRCPLLYLLALPVLLPVWLVSVLVLAVTGALWGPRDE